MSIYAVSEDYTPEALAQAATWARDHGPLVDAAFASFQKGLEWPTARVLQRSLDRSGAGVEVAGALVSIPATLGSTWNGLDGVVHLNVRALQHCDAARPLLGKTLKLIQLAAERYPGADDDDSPEITAADLVDLFGDDPETALGVLALVRGERAGVLSSSAGTPGSADWHASINDATARMFRSISSIADYLEAEATFHRTHGLPAALVRPVNSVQDLLADPTSLAVAPAEAAQDPSEDEDDSMAMARLRVQQPGEYLLRQLGDRDRDRLIAATDNGVPTEALVVAARWWQLESYLRLLVYIQLRALLGPDWQRPLKQPTMRRAAAAADIGYMASADDGYLLAHADVGVLFDLITTYWDQCQHGIGLRERVWQGKVEEIVPIRHRIAHCRRPHVDDIERIEQLLRDLEPAANRALRSYVDWQEVTTQPSDPVFEDWVNLRHEDARRLVPHGAQNKGIYFTLMASRLPWAEAAAPITGTPGWFWVMHVVLPGSHLYIDDYLAESGAQVLLPLAGHIIEPYGSLVAVTLPAVGDPTQISLAIGGFFEAIFSSRTHGIAEAGIRHPWRRSPLVSDPRVDAAGLLSVLSGLNEEDPLSIFAAR